MFFFFRLFYPNRGVNKNHGRARRKKEKEKMRKASGIMLLFRQLCNADSAHTERRPRDTSVHPSVRLSSKRENEKKKDGARRRRPLTSTDQRERDRETERKRQNEFDLTTTSGAGRARLHGRDKTARSLARSLLLQPLSQKSTETHSLDIHWAASFNVSKANSRNGRCYA